MHPYLTEKMQLPIIPIIIQKQRIDWLDFIKDIYISL